MASAFDNIKEAVLKKFPGLKNESSRKSFFALLALIVVFIFIFIMNHTRDSEKKVEQGGPESAQMSGVNKIDPTAYLDIPEGITSDVIMDGSKPLTTLVRDDDYPTFTEQLFDRSPVSEDYLGPGGSSYDPLTEVPTTATRQENGGSSGPKAGTLDLFGLQSLGAIAQEQGVVSGSQPQTQTPAYVQPGASAQQSQGGYPQTYSSITSSVTENMTQAEMEALAKQLAEEKLRSMGIDPVTGMALDPKTVQNGSRSTATATQGGTSSSTSTTPSSTTGGSSDSATSASETAPQPAALPSEKSYRKSGQIGSLRGDAGAGDGIESQVNHEDVIKNVDTHPYMVMFQRDEKVQNGSRVSIRLLEDMIIDGYKIPENTPLSGIVGISGNRLDITVVALKTSTEIIRMNLVAYDTDGIRGLYCPQTNMGKAEQQAVKSGKNIAQTALSSVIGSTASQIVSSGAQIIDTATGNVTVSISGGYRFALLKEKKR